MFESVDRVTEIAGRVAAASDDYDSNGKSALYFGREWHYDLRPDDVRFIARSRDDTIYLLERLRTAEAEVKRNEEGWAVAFRAGVQHQEARERLEAELVTVKQQRSDNLRAIAEMDAVIADAIAEARALVPSFDLLTDRERYGFVEGYIASLLSILNRAGADHDQ